MSGYQAGVDERLTDEIASLRLGLGLALFDPNIWSVSSVDGKVHDMTHSVHCGTSFGRGVGVIRSIELLSRGKTAEI